MLSRFWNYQLLLSGSIGFVNAKNKSKLYFLKIFIFIIFISIFIGNIDGIGVIFFPIAITLCMVYSIVNSQNKLFEIVPVSKLYSLINIYLYVFVTNLAITAGSIIGFMLTRLLTQLTPVLDRSLFADTWKGILITVFISTIMASILVPIFFIKLKTLRKTLTIAVVILITIALMLFGNELPMITMFGKIKFLESITIVPHYNAVLSILACVCVVIIPISIFISYRLYKGKRCLVC